MVVESTGGDGVSCTGCMYTSGNGETKQCRRRPWYDILISIACRLSRVVECIRGFMTLLCKGWLIHSIKPRGRHGNGETMMTQCRGRPWSDLPNDILISIASRLGRVECIRFMTVCKGWLHSIKPRGHLNHLKPCLLVMEKGDLGCLSLYTPFPSSKTYKLRIPELKDTIFRFSKDGWILLSKTLPSNTTSNLSLLNLLTGAKFDLPDLNIVYNDISGICFTSTPGSSDFMVVVIRSVLPQRVTIFTYRPSSLKEEEKQKWTEECNYENSSRTSFLGVSCNPIFYQGKFYCLDRFGHLGAFDPVRKNWRIVVSDRPKYFVMNPPPPLFDDEFAMPPAFSDFPYKSFMVDLEGEDLISVFEYRRKTPAKEKVVHVFRLDCCKMGWEKVDSLGGMRELFVGLPTSISTIQVPYGSWNKLYFPGLKFNHRDVIFSEAYSLETKAYYDPSCSSLWRDPFKFTWIELPISKWESTFYSKWKRM